ncbi:MAG: hypothetical protein WBJ16_04560 [Smithellaceae bacterium]|mgnify:CR=1 FL=1
MKTEKEIIQEELEKKQSQLDRVSSETKAWNKSKFNNSSNAAMSKILEESLKKDIANLQKKLEEIDNKNIER